MNNIYRISAFEYNGNGGNPAGVVLDADSLSESDMLHIAKEVGYSETAFVMSSSQADFRVRFYTPVAEVDLCGHATIATFNLLRDLGKVTSGTYTQETKAGILELIIGDRYVYMEQALPVFGEVIPKYELCTCFNIDDKDLLEDLPIQIVSTGLRDIILPIRNFASLCRLKANNEYITSISEKFDVVGIHAYCLESIDGAHAHTRNFAPRYGIDEESATGTSNGALACYLSKYTNVGLDGYFEFEQGYGMNSPSRVYVRLKQSDGNIEKVFVGGSARRL